MVSNFKLGLKAILQHGLSEPEFYGDLVYKLKKKNVSRTDFSDQFRNVIMRYKRIGYINVMRQSACLVINPITVDSFVSLFTCTPVSRIRLNDGPNINLVYLFMLVGTGLSLVCC